MGGTRFDATQLAGLSFHDARSGRDRRYIYPDTNHWTAGWIVYKTQGGDWVTYRKATQDDIVSLNGAVARGHHSIEA